MLSHEIFCLHIPGVDRRQNDFDAESYHIEASAVGTDCEDSTHSGPLENRRELVCLDPTKGVSTTDMKRGLDC